MVDSNSHTPDKPELLCSRFLLLNIFRSGGMATIQKAVDSRSGDFIAIKRMKTSGDEQRLKTSFHREVESIRVLEHPNIIKFVTVDQDENGCWFLGMEWIEETLESRLLRTGSMSWSNFIATIGFPLLSALEYAQRRNIVHRDLNPRNVMVTDGGVPKITDYGLSKVIDDLDAWAPAKGGTLVNARTAGFSPKEIDDRVNSRSRDCFSFAAVAVFCMAGRKIVGDDDLPIALQEAAMPPAARAIIEQALSDNPAERPFDAGVMLAAIERAEVARVRANDAAVRCYLDLSVGAERRLRSVLGLNDRKEVEQFILDELEEEPAIVLQREPDGSTRAEIFDIIGTSWRFRASLAGGSNERLEIFDPWNIDAARAGKYREDALRTKFVFSFGRPLNAKNAASSLKELIQRVAAHEQEVEDERNARSSERIFRAWKGYLRDRVDLEARRENSIRYINRRITENTVSFTTEIATSPDIVGQHRLVRVGNRIIQGIVTGVVLDRVTWEVSAGELHTLPNRGELLLNTVAAKRSLDHQNAALDAIMFDRAANPRLKAILLDPRCATEPIAVAQDAHRSSKLTGEKLSALRLALGTTELLAIEGPPGTSKTDIIAEIVTTWLTQNPNHRILLSSQTHTALDEAIERIADSKNVDSIIRIGRPDDPRIAQSSKPLLLEPRVDLWAAKVRAAAGKNLESWADANGVDRDLVAMGMRVERLLQTLLRLSRVDELIAEQEGEFVETEDRIEAATTPDQTEELDEATQEIADELTLLKSSRRALRVQERKAREELRVAGGYGAGLSESHDVSELAEWQELFLSGDDKVEECKARLSLLEQWLLRVGRTGEFNAAVLRESKVIAGTCVGIAGVRGMEEVEYDLCIVDEASKATATEILVPMSRGRRWIIVGDPKQLPPFFEELGPKLLTEFDETTEIRRTVLDRMLDDKNGVPAACKIDLQVQHRMVVPIGDLVSHCFYGGKLKSPIRSHGLQLDPELSKAVSWFTTSRNSRRGEKPVGDTFENVLEAEWIKRIIDRCQLIAVRAGRKLTVAVISGYMAQVTRLAKMSARNASDWPDLHVTCNTVDAFQGKQADICIYSVVRSNKSQVLGFLKEKPRLNVALSRARSALVIVGDHHFCLTARGENPFKSVIEWVDGHDSCQLLPLT